MRITAQRFLYTILFLSLIFSSLANPPDYSEIIASRFAKVWHFMPQEKVYLHTDKPYLYSAGDDIWFRAHLVNASTLQPNARSNFVYVELIDKSDSVITRVKIKKDETSIAGKIALSPEIVAGEYVLRAYTNWMKNDPSDFFFHKKIYIGNAIDDRIIVNHQFGTPENGKIPLTIKLTNTYATPLVEKAVMVHHGETRKRQLTSKHTTDQQGEINVLIDIDSTAVEKKFIEISLNEPGLKLNRKVQVPYVNKDFDLQFFPESGVFLDNQIQTIAFKAVGNNGLSCNITGKIYNNKQEEITPLESFHKGMGKVIIRTTPGESYYAVVQNATGIEKRVELPPTSSEGIALQIVTNHQTVYYSVLNQTKIPNEALFLMVHIRGIVFLVNPLTESEGYFINSMLPPGICTYTVIDSLGNVYCERLSFIRNANPPMIEMLSDKAKYAKREPVQLNFTVLSNDSLPAKGSFSVSVTDSYLVAPDSINDNILSYLLLSGDVKGFIEEPLEYFKDNSALTNEKTDILMLTQGWRRFNTADILKAKLSRPKFYIEAGQTVSGRVINLFDRPVKNSEVYYLSDFNSQISLAKTDSVGQFIIEGVEIPDSTHIVLKAKSKTKIVDVEIIPDDDVFPNSNNKVLFHDIHEEIQNEYFSLAKEKYYDEGGMLVINLDEFTVDASAKTEVSKKYFYTGMADNTINAATLKNNPGTNIFVLFSMLPGVQVSGRNVRVRGANEGPLFLVDGFETTAPEDIDYLSASDIDEIALFKGPSTVIFGLRGANGVIAVTLKTGVTSRSFKSTSLAHLSPLGYQKPSEFYVPKYEVDSILNAPKSDLRTTIYWAPQVQTDEQGKLKLSFYTADKVNDYNVELEGVTENGEVCRYKGVLKRE